MKRLLVLTPLLLATYFAHADLVVEQKIESPFMNGASVTKIKGDKMRMDSPMPGGAGTMSSIVDNKTGDATTLMHSQKMAMKMNMKAMQAAAQKATGGSAANPANIEKPKPTGQKEKVGKFDAEVYEMKASGQTIKMWVVKDYPNAAAYKNQMDQMMKASSGGTYDPAQFEVPGITVKTQLATPQGNMTMTLVSIKEETVPDTEFQVPADYKTMDMPQLPGAAPAPAAK